MKTRTLARTFRIRNRRFNLAKRTGQVAIYTTHDQRTSEPLGFEVMLLKPTGKCFEFINTLIEYYPPEKDVLRFTAAQEVDAWQTFQNMVDNLYGK
jgi:hypothetical protein